MAEIKMETTSNNCVMEFGARKSELEKMNHFCTMSASMNEVLKDSWKDGNLELVKKYDMSLPKQEYADEFRINMELYGDANHYGLLVISDSRKNPLNPLPLKSISLEKVTLEAIGAAVVEYLRQNCLEK